MTARNTASGKETLLDVAYDFFVQRSYAEVSMQEIAEAAGMTKGAPYYHFKSKDDLFLQVFNREVDRLIAGFLSCLSGDAPFPERLRAAVIFALESTKGDVTRLFNDFQHHIAPRIQSGTFEHNHQKIDITDAIIPAFEAAAGAGGFSRTKPEVAARLFMILTMGEVQAWRFDHMLGRESPTSEMLADQVVDLLFHGI